MTSPGAALDAVLREAVESGGVPGVVAAVTGAADLRYEAAVGSAALESGRPMRLDAVFRIASMTKPITTLALLKLRDEGRLELDAPFARYWPAFRQPEVLVSLDRATLRYTTRPAATPVTVRHLLTHTSGFGYWFLSEELRLLTQAAPDVFGAPFLLHDPGERFTYGIGTDVLGCVIEPLTGVELEGFLRRSVLEPLGMRDTGFAVPADPERLAALHARVDDGFLERPNERAGEGARGGGALYSTAHDYVALLRLLLNRGRVGREELLDPGSIDELRSNQIGSLWAERQATAFPPRTLDFMFLDGTQKYGYNVCIETRERPGGRGAGSYGWGGIFNTWFWVDPRAGVAAVLLTQSSPFSDPATLGLLDAFERAVYRHWVR